MKMKKIISAFIIGISIVSCLEKKETNWTETENNQLKAKADSIANISQKTLLRNVASAMEKGGTEYALEFCNLKADSLTNDLSKEYAVAIHRISDKNRNPENRLKTKNQKAVFEDFKSNPDLVDTLISAENHFVYYKKITTALPSCLKCHGNPETDIEPETYKKIKTLYPNDKAEAYALNELRGLWEIVIEK
jgi:hypothetical protein